MMDENLALRATFPSASVFKVVTAAAAISERKMNAGSIVSFNGRAHTLYKRNIFGDATNRWTTHMTLKDAFAHSVNAVFGKLGVFIVGPTELKSYAEKFGFNRKLPSDLPVQQGKAEITEDPWEIAEAASGFTKHNTMSPLQGALIAAAEAIESSGRAVIVSVSAAPGSIRRRPGAGASEAWPRSMAAGRAGMFTTTYRGPNAKVMLASRKSEASSC